MHSEHPTSQRLIIFHGKGCIDGIKAAVLLAQSLAPLDGVDTIFLSYDHSTMEEDQAKILAALRPGTEIYFVDCAPEPAFLDILMQRPEVKRVEIEDHHETMHRKLKNYKPPKPLTSARMVRRVEIEDHHETAHRKLKNYKPPKSLTSAPALMINIDPLQTSATGMLWRSKRGNETPPDLVQMLDKMDGDSSGLVTEEDFAAAAYIDSHDISTLDKAFASLSKLLKEDRNTYVTRGMLMLPEQKERLRTLFANVALVPMTLFADTAPVLVPCVRGEINDFPRMISKELTTLGKHHGVGVAFAWAVRPSGGVRMALRSDGNPHVGQIAEYIASMTQSQGGGHPKSAAVSFSNVQAFQNYTRLAA